MNGKYTKEIIEVIILAIMVFLISIIFYILLDMDKKIDNISSNIQSINTTINGWKLE